MTYDLTAFMAILGMGAVTYLTRIAGVLILSRVSLSPGLKRWLEQIPGAVIMSIVAPAVLAAGPAEALAGLAALAAAVFTRSLPLAMVAGVGVVYLARHFLG